MVELPQPTYRVRSASSRCIEEIMRSRHEEDEHMFAPGQERLGHYYLPPFQRPHRWSVTQSARLIESIHLGISIGSIVVTDCRETIRVVVDGITTERFPDSADWLIDGQQRMRAIDGYLKDAFPVFVGTRHEHRYSDLNHAQKRRMMNRSVGFILLEDMTVDELRNVYDLMNFGGTIHEEHERASTQATS